MLRKSHVDEIGNGAHSVPLRGFACRHIARVLRVGGGTCSSRPFLEFIGIGSIKG
jgi:hypothetical protein